MIRTRTRIARGLAVGTGALASGALVLAVAPAASASEDAPPPRRAAELKDKPFVGARLVPTAEGATVAHVIEGGPVDEAGIEVGDVVVAIDGIELDHRGALREALSDAAAGQELTVVFTHDGAQATATVTLGEPTDRPAPPAPADAPWVGARLVHYAAGDGVLVRSVQADSPAYDAGLAKGDVITAVDGAAVSEWWEVQEAVRTHAPGDVLSLTVDRDGATVTLSLTLGSADEAPARPAPRAQEPRERWARPGVGVVQDGAVQDDGAPAPAPGEPEPAAV